MNKTVGARRAVPLQGEDMECPECKADIDEELVKVIMVGLAVQLVCDGCGEVFIHVLKPKNWRRKYNRGVAP